MIHSQRTAEIDIMISISHCRRPQFMSNVINNAIYTTGGFKQSDALKCS